MEGIDDKYISRFFRCEKMETWVLVERVWHEWHETQNKIVSIKRRSVRREDIICEVLVIMKQAGQFREDIIAIIEEIDKKLYERMGWHIALPFFAYSRFPEVKDSLLRYSATLHERFLFVPPFAVISASDIPFIEGLIQEFVDRLSEFFKSNILPQILASEF